MDFDVAIASPKGDGQGRQIRQAAWSAGQDAPRRKNGTVTQDVAPGGEGIRCR